MDSVTANIHITADLASRGDDLARITGQSRDQLVADVLNAYLEQENMERERSRAGVAEADRGEFASDEEIEALFARYGGPNRDALRRQSARDLREAHHLSACDYRGGLPRSPSTASSVDAVHGVSPGA
jgi:RHH-type transcriptional regulator, rel operon repressor / antitoxin RelB